MNEILIGKRTILFPMQPHDLDLFIKLHKEDKKGFLGRFTLHQMSDDEARKYILLLLATHQIYVWTARTKEGKASRTAGFIYLTELTDFSAVISGIMDKEFAVGLTKQLRKDKYTFSQDTLVTLIQFLFGTLNLERIECDVFDNNKLALALIQKTGFTKEGFLRNYMKQNGELHSVAIFSLLRGEWEKCKKDQAQITVAH